MSEYIDYDDVIKRVKAFWATSNDAEKSALRQILFEIADRGESPTYEDIWLADYKEIPVDIDTFLDDNQYLGIANNGGQSIYPFWRQCMEQIFHAGNKYEEVFFTGATRTGKSSTGVTCTAYMLYKLMCLKNPQRYFQKKDISKFSILFFNLTLKLSRGVGFQEFNNLLRSSPWFVDHGTFSNESIQRYIPEGNRIEITFGSDASQALGQQVFCGFMDELNFSRAGVKDVQKSKEHMSSLFTTVTDRVKGTFRMNGEVYGKIFAISSKRSDSDYMEEYIHQQQSAGYGEHMFVADKPQWEVQPASNFSKERFYIAVGDRYHKGFVVEDDSDEALDELISQGYRLLQPPIDYKSQFQADFDIALRDIAGISVPGALSAFTQQLLDTVISTDIKNPFHQDILEIGMKDSLEITDFFHLDAIPERIRRCPCYIHLDLSEFTDKSGIGCVAITGSKDSTSEDGKTLTQMPVFTHIFSISIQAPRGDTIPYAKIQRFILWLRKNHFNIAGISRDQYQSSYMGQLLTEEGFQVDKISLDRTPDGYDCLKNVMLEGRIQMLDQKLLQHELIFLQKDAVTGKYDHPMGGCFSGDTKIKTSTGIQTIKALVQENRMYKNTAYGYSESTGMIFQRKILQAFRTKLVSELTKITLNTGEEIKCTSDHRFMLSDGTYVEAQNLKENQALMTTDFKGQIKSNIGVRPVTSKTVKSVEKISLKAPEWVYDLTMEGDHNFALACGVIVHNSKDAADGFAGAVWNGTMKADRPSVPLSTAANAMKAFNQLQIDQNNPYSYTDRMFGNIKKY